MKKLTTLILTLFTTLAFAGEMGGNSSGGDEVWGAPTIPYQAPRAKAIGVVETLTPGTPQWTVTFKKTFLAHGTTLTFTAPPNQMNTPKVGDILFLRGGLDHYFVGRTVKSSP